MSKLCAALLFLTLVGLARSSSDPLARIRDKVTPHFHRREMFGKRQGESCSFPDSYPSECITASSDFAALLATPNLEDIDLNSLNAALDEICSDACLGPQIELLECSGEEDLADLFNNGYCGQSDGTNCFVRWIDGINSGDVVPLSTCSADGTCDSSCQSSLQGTADYLGCCASSLYNNTVSPFSILISPDEFSACNITLAAMCEGAYSGAEVVAEVGLGLLTIFAVIATLINAVL